MKIEFTNRILNFNYYHPLANKINKALVIEKEIQYMDEKVTELISNYKEKIIKIYYDEDEELRLFCQSREVILKVDITKIIIRNELFRDEKRIIFSKQMNSNNISSFV